MKFTNSMSPAVLLWTMCHALLLRISVGQIATQQECETTNSTGFTEYRACLANTESLNNLMISARVEPEDYTCGYGQTQEENFYCTLDVSFQCNLCNATDPSLAHPPSYIYDQQDPTQPTWWQSITWYMYSVPLEVDVTLSLNHSYTINSKIEIIFQSSLPQRMILEKSSDYGSTWQPYQYYAYDCGYFQMAATDELSLTSPTQVICSEDYSSGVRTVFYPGGSVIFNVENRLALLTNSTLPEEFQKAYESNLELQAFLEITNLRLKLLYPATDGLEWTGQYYSLIRYYYAISNIDTFLICNCNLHGKFCYQDSNSLETICQCFHNTMGKSCEQCLPLYNNRPWMAGSALPFPEGTANECEKCNCNNHSVSCTYSQEVGQGVCNDCQDNTAGISCEICISGLYRNSSVPASSPNSCIECNCEPLGTMENETTCSQYAANNKPIGQCSCQENVEGRACDVCIDQYYGLLLNETEGTCKDCSCNRFGTVNASNICEKEAGQCPCKPNADTRTCGQCKDSFYGYPISENEDCLACDCNPGGSISPACNKVSGRCTCRSNVTSRQCSMTVQGFYFNYLDSNSYDAWGADSDCIRTSSVPFDLFTGRGYQKCYQGNQVTFRGVTAVTSLADNALFYRPVIRYTYVSSSPWLQANLNIVSAQSDAGTSLCPVAVGTTISTVAFSLPPGESTGWYASSGQSVMLDRRCNYDVTLRLTNDGSGSEEIEIDSLVLLPTGDSFPIYTQGDAAQRSFYDECLRNISVIGKRQSAIDLCRDFMFVVSTESNDGAVACDCDPTGSIGSSCNSYGGECVCQVRVGGQRCDRCLPGFFGFTENGCTACDCDSTGSLSLACDFNTGQCPCKDGVALRGQRNSNDAVSDRRCQSCLANYYDFNSGGGCMACLCSAEGSVNPQCSDTGVCECKETITGNKCSICVQGYFSFSAAGCIACGCNLDGSTDGTCHPDLGTCTCKANVQGDKCDQCLLGHFNLQPSNPNGCQPCFCFGHGTQCNAAPSYIASAITSDFTQGSTTGWTATDPSSLMANPTSVRVLHPASLPLGSYVYLRAPRKFLGEHLDLYGQQLSYTMKLDTGGANTTSARYLTITGGRSDMGVYYNQEAFTPELTRRTFVATFYETYWRVVGEERAPNVAEFQEILSDIKALVIQASFGPGTASTFYNVRMDSAQSVSNPADYSSFVTVVEQCTCDSSSNTMGLSCEQCQASTYRQNNVDEPFDTCRPCDCNGRSTTCDSVTGVCQDCQLGTIGDQCASCADNVQEPLCDRCMPNHYGFGTDLFDGACAACNCNITGTGGATQCDISTGQCPCTGNYGGMFCDSCQFNYFDYANGCSRCDVCYDSISTEHTDLLLQAANLTSFVETLWAADTSATLGPFIERLMATYNQMLYLVLRTDEVIREGNNLTMTVATLNTTMMQLLASLDGTIKTSIQTSQENQASIEGLLDQARVAMVSIELALINSYNGLSSGDIQSYQLTLGQLVTELAGIQTQLTTLSSSVTIRELLLTQQVTDLSLAAGTAVQTAEEALMTVQQAQSVHDNTTSHTAALVTKANEVTTLGQQTQQAVSEVMERAQMAQSAGEGGAEGTMSASIEELRQESDDVIQEAMSKILQAAGIEAQVTAKQEAAASVISDVEATGTLTESLVITANSTLEEVNARYNRALAANQSATEAVASSTATFTAAEEMLAIVTNFESQSSAAQTAADEALLKQTSIQTLSSETTTIATDLKAQLTPINITAQEGLTKANQALQSVEVEAQNIRPVSQKAQQLATESATKLQDTSEITNSIRTINATQYQPAKAQCDLYTPDLVTLEGLVLQANTEAQTATDEALATEAATSKLLVDVRNIQQVDLAELPALMVRIEQARATFTQGDFAQLVTLLSQAVAEQQVWLDNTQIQVTEMQEQIDALESFKVSQ
ncbi:laminin subunit alpha-3-like isoform X2 [Asterias rubens]|uniref:laminin subunit alpha-3-like isoform X2 n=1 Tax=Asterias rubens TaxID=7604 RepID=UPI001455C4EE|nr:laminin subunit alpha-3-like isoform X2 [Asterias rubens]